ncbi:MAG: acyl-CoA dehydrogenase family protein [Burkholderiaceae bacterium]|nr:acyl-CoA dehydrogenase family protein [Burkholderiaceae bacterium]
MDFSLSEEVRMMQESVREFTERELFPLEREFCLEGRLPQPKRLELEKKGRDLGFWALDVPTEYGGAGLGQLAMCVIHEELYRSPLMFEFGGFVEPALYLTNERQKDKYFHSIVRGERKSCYAFTEPGAGSDLARVQTRAVKKGDHWIINGSKTFISHVDRADFIMVFALTNPGKGAKGLTCFLVEKNAPGLHISNPIRTMGDDWDPYTLSFEDCVVPDENVLGEVDRGFVVADEQLTHGRLKIAAYNIGIAKRCLEMAVAYSKERVTFGQPLASRQAIQWMLADSEVELMAARLLVYQAAYMADSKREIRNEAFVAKLYATEMAQRVTDRALQIFGGMGYCLEVPIQSFYRQVRVWRIGHGTSEIHRMMIARNMLRD